MIRRLPIALPAATLLGWLSYKSLTARPPVPEDRLAIALERERAHDPAGAEKALLAAAAWDRLYQPRWTLAGFYFRHDRPDDFWLWARKALEVGNHDLGGLFELCWRESNDPGEIWRRAIPARREIWNEYLAFLLDARHWEAAAQTAARLAERSTEDDVPVLLGFCDLAIERKDSAAALPVWNGLARRRLIASSAIESGHYLVNGDLANQPLRRGFDWRLPGAEGLREEWTPGQLHISLSGNQPDRAELATQPLALPAGGKFRFTYRFQSQGIPAGSGLRWLVSSSAAPLTSDSAASGTMTFATPAGGGDTTLTLLYDRPPGAPKPAGTVLLSGMNIVRE